MNDNRGPRPNLLDILSRRPATRVLQSDVNAGFFLPGRRQLFSLIDCESIKALEQADEDQGNLVQGIGLTETLHPR